jgi:signal peptide peptidase SppA
MAEPIQYQRILNAFFNTPLAMLPAKIEEVRAFLQLKAGGADVAPERIEGLVAANREREERLKAEAGPEFEAAIRHQGAIIRGKTAIIPVFGAISQRLGLFEAMSGGVSTEAVGATLDGLMDDKEVRSIVLSFDSPGGSVFGVEELGSKIRAYRDQKRIIGLADSMAASAAYWLLAQTSEINVTPGGQVGSVGVYAAHVDMTEHDKLKGIKTTLVSSTPEKVEFSPELPLTEEARGELQRMVNLYYRAFIGAVAKGRGLTEHRVENDFGKGRMFLAKESVERGMADHVRTLGQVLHRLGASGSGPSATVSSGMVEAEKFDSARTFVLQGNGTWAEWPEPGATGEKGDPIGPGPDDPGPEGARGEDGQLTGKAAERVVFVRARELGSKT